MSAAVITIADYFMGRREQYPLAMGPAIERNAVLTVDLANKLLAQAATYGVSVPINPGNGTLVNSGWRPPAVNAATKGASTASRHMTGQAIDIHDPAGKLDAWLMTGEGQAALAALGLWLEHPDSTPGWTHVQTVPPGSGRRVFHP